jgi:hypothetical protein
MVQERLKQDRMAIMLVFRGRRGGLLKVLRHDGQGMCLFAKRLERGRFHLAIARGRAALRRRGSRYTAAHERHLHMVHSSGATANAKSRNPENIFERSLLPQTGHLSRT